MGARQSLQSEVEPRQRSNSTSEASGERSQRFARQSRNSENVSTDSEIEMDLGEFMQSGSSQNMRFSFRPSSSPRLSFLQALAAGMNGQSSAHSSGHHSSPRDRRSMPMLKFLVSGRDIKCPVCHKRVPSDDAEVHLVMCFTRPHIAYNEDVLTEEKGECAICLEEMEAGDTIARLPCLCIYHKQCIDQWFKRKNCCPEHPGED